MIFVTIAMVATIIIISRSNIVPNHHHHCHHLAEPAWLWDS